MKADLKALRAELLRLERVVVAFSGGTDSAFLAWVATDTLGPRNVTCVTAVSPSLAESELTDCKELATEWGLQWLTVETNEMESAAYRVNDGDRCYHCKSALMDVTEPIAAAAQGVVLLGVNVDDLGDYRPGQNAAAERDAQFPLVVAGYTKQDVREHSRVLGLRTWDKPAAACLASRIPYGTGVTVSLLRRVDRAESALKEMGFRQLRVRDYDSIARLEFEVTDLPIVIEQREKIVKSMKRLGYEYVTIDLEGFRSGNLNQGLL
jgi:uncharacterized protein